MKKRHYILLTLALGLLFNRQTNAQIIITIAGTRVYGYNGDTIPATSAQLKKPRGVVLDAAGNIYITDVASYRVRKIDVNGIITTIAGTGAQGYGGDGGPAISATFKTYGLFGIDVDAAGNIYLANFDADRVRKIDASGTINTIAGIGSFGYNGDNRPATSAQLSKPAGIAVDATGNIYIADQLNNRVRKIDPTGIITTIAGTGNNVYNGDGIQATTANIHGPMGVAVDAAGNIYIAAENGHRVRKVDPSGIITTIAGTGTSGYSGDGGPGNLAEIYYPCGVAVDAAGNVYIAELGNHTVRKIDTNGIITTIAGTGTKGYNGDGILASTAELNTPFSVTLDSLGDIYIADRDNHRIRKISYCISISKINRIVCDSFVSPSGRYTWKKDGTYLDTIPNAEGCDSLITIDLTVNSTLKSTQNVAICQGQTYTLPGGTQVSTGGNYTDTLRTTAGCDSIITTNLTFNSISKSTQDVAICQGQTYTLPGGTQVSTGGNYTDTLRTTAGCDSIITTKLTITAPNTTTNVYKKCKGYTITVNGNTYDSTGVYTDIVGCDTTITDLTIYPNPTLTLIKEDDSCNSDIGSVTAIVTSNNPPITYSWNTGATDSSINNLSAGTYSITITDSIGCTTSGSITLDSCHNALIIPNIITPNGDGKNDVFKIRGIALYPGTKVLIFNRWGREVYKNDDYQNDWDGGDLTDGSYLYIITVNDKEQTVYKGNLTILNSGK